MSPSDRLAEAAQGVVDLYGDYCGLATALAAYDAAKELREAEREYLEAQYALDKLDLEPGPADEYQAALTTACETFDRLYALRQKLLAARAKVKDV